MNGNELSAAFGDEPYRTLVQGIRDFVIILLTEKGLIVSWNTGAEMIFGFRSEEVAGRHFSLIFTEEDNARRTAERELIKAAETGRAEDLRWHRRRDGSLVFLNGVTSPIKNKNGAPAGYAKIARDDTEQRQIRDALAESNLRTSSILESITDAFFSLDREWRFTYVNREAEKLLFRGSSELLGKCVWDEFPEAVGSTFYKEYYRAAQSGQSVAFEEFYPPLETWFEVRAYPSAAGLSVYFHNVNERKKSERELRESAAKLRLALESGGMGWWNFDPQTNRSEPDEKCLALFGINPADYQGDAALLFAAIHPDDRARVHREITEAIETRGVYDTEFRVVNASDGSIRWLAGIGRVTYDEKNGLPQQMYGVNFDVTDRRQTEEILRRSEERFRGLQQATPDGFMIFESVRDEHTGAIRDFRWLYVNPAAEAIIGRAEKDLIGKLLLEEMPGNREEGLFDAYINVVETGEVWRKEFSYAHEGLDHYFLSTAVKTGDGFAVAFSDITERRRAEHEREELLAKEQAARAQAESAIRAKDEFLAVVTHELRSPLNSILGWNTMLQKQPSAEMVSRVTEIIERQGKQQLQLIEDLLDTARIVSGKMKIEQQPVDLASVITAALDVVRPAAQSKNVLLSLTIGKSCVVTGDAERLQQIIWNLLSNAVKFTAEGGRVEIELSRRDPFAVIVVRDNGKGIAPSFLPFVFDRFSQADSTKSRRFGGLGLGLSLVKQLAELHGGTIEVESEGEGKGALFTLKLPIRAVGAAKTSGLQEFNEKLPPFFSGASAETFAVFSGDQSEFGSASPAADEISANGRNRLSGARILIADDLQDARELVALTFINAGAQVEAFASGAEALAVFADESRPSGTSFDLFVCDIGMPDEDGYAVIEKLRRIEKARVGGKKIPAIALTAFSGSHDKQRALEAGFDRHVSKPVETEELILMAEALLAAG